ncbi:FKBP-type peptidyl-prolyl cis-trans isomerase [Prevotella copri]|uniref:FKBP-type peptidyl-prolyl cis-trans isomerase n=1 Tax=Segatella copri TaxID=165179 RepID=UPI001C38846C|nr:FKBP-type peptidyl-prolyl cis-trans isomerase [Segatella copri]MBV3429859.1 FKBP-type peptidyl-prolyl cis-trans isomerase [Segatella copri]
MKKYLMTALVLVASASLFTASAAKKKNVKKVTPVVLATESDSLSYAAGVHATRGLIPFIQQSYKVDTAYMADFIRGYEEAIAKANTPQGTAYIVGMQIAQMVNQRILPGTREELKSAKDSIDAAMFSRGFVAALANDTTLFSVKKAGEFKTQILAGAGEKFLAANAKKPGVKVLPSGLQYKVIKAGQGEVPKATDEVEVIYEGRLIDGTVFDATSKHGGAKTDKFRAGNLIKGWTEALTTMPVGSKWQLYIPYELAYGERQAGQIPPYSTLIFDLELVSIVKPEVKAEPAGELKKDVAVGAEKKVVKTPAKSAAKKAGSKKRK